jgi:hypothetical protein
MPEIGHLAERVALYGKARGYAGKWFEAVLMDDLIPPWCSGIDRAFWREGYGLRLAWLFFDMYQGDMISIAEAVRILDDGRKDLYRVNRLRGYFRTYPYPKNRVRVYVRKSDILALKASGNYPKRRWAPGRGRPNK